MARVLCIIASYKIRSNMCGRKTFTRDKIQKNAILFCQENIERLSNMLNGHEMFDEKGLELLIQIFLLDDKGHLDDLIKSAYGRLDMLARPWVVVQWIVVLVHVHPLYENLDIPNLLTVHD